MMNGKQFAAFLGFGFVAIWIAFGFGEAVLCLVGATVFFLVVTLASGELDLEEMRNRVPRRS